MRGSNACATGFHWTNPKPNCTAFKQVGFRLKPRFSGVEPNFGNMRDKALNMLKGMPTYGSMRTTDW